MTAPRIGGEIGGGRQHDVVVRGGQGDVAD